MMSTIHLAGKILMSLDASGRLTIPKRLRKHLSEDLIIFLFSDSEFLHLSVYTLESFGAWVDRVLESRGVFDLESETHYALRREINSSCVDCHMDARGRILLSAPLRAHISNSNSKELYKVVLIGADDHMEIWSESTYDECESFYRNRYFIPQAH